jgi:pimeloyl-ACP methyl ester carboxylesterase
MHLEVDGAKVAASTGGAGLNRSRPLLVLVHGAGMDHTVWAPLARFFARHGWSVLAVDLPGHGGSAGDVAASVDDHARWLLQVVATAGWDRAALVGHSLGSLIALRAAALDPGHVTNLVLVGTAAPMPVHPDLLAAACAGDRRAVELVVSWSLTRPDHIGGHPTPGMWMTGAGMRLMERIDPKALAADLAACNEHTSAIADAAAVRCPVLVVTGEHDRMTPPAAAGPLLAAFPQATAVVIPGAGHFAMVDRSDDLIDSIAPFLGVV